MHNPITGINGISLARSPQQQEIHSLTPAAALGFNETLAAVKAATQDQAERMKRKYRVQVRIQTVSTEDQEIKSLGLSGGQQEIIIAPNILQQMAKDPAMQNKVYAAINPYFQEHQAGLKPMEQPNDVQALTHSLIVHKDGKITVWTAPAASAEGRETGQRPDAAKRKGQTGETRAAAERRHAWEAALPVLSGNLRCSHSGSLQGSKVIMNPVNGTAVHDWLQQIQLMRARRAGKSK
ncbi:DUF6033 family protein [Paenibacillus sp. S150]|uniref:DUF6033 family protein n=1 Tax=Paenibacillus sp. S150 TaxID=2749826 RepID=UPI001C577BD6|nr:DUF6033 family protein [Paenibacillus sp. S150]MBW4084489.1 hypothetical protein [Paenibacillus sp. S150]